MLTVAQNWFYYKRNAETTKSSQVEESRNSKTSFGAASLALARPGAVEGLHGSEEFTNILYSSIQASQGARKLGNDPFLSSLLELDCMTSSEPLTKEQFDQTQSKVHEKFPKIGEWQQKAWVRAIKRFASENREAAKTSKKNPIESADPKPMVPVAMSTSKKFGEGSQGSEDSQIDQFLLAEQLTEPQEVVSQIGLSDPAASTDKVDVSMTDNLEEITIRTDNDFDKVDLDPSPNADMVQRHLDKAEEESVVQNKVPLKQESRNITPRAKGVAISRTISNEVQKPMIRSDKSNITQSKRCSGCIENRRYCNGEPICGACKDYFIVHDLEEEYCYYPYHHKSIPPHKLTPADFLVFESPQEIPEHLRPRGSSKNWYYTSEKDFPELSTHSIKTEHHTEPRRKRLSSNILDSSNDNEDSDANFFPGRSNSRLTGRQRALRHST